MLSLARRAGLRISAKICVLIYLKVYISNLACQQDFVWLFPPPQADCLEKDPRTPYRL